MATPTRSFVAVPNSGASKLAVAQYTDGADIKNDEVDVLGEQHLPTYIFSTGAISLATALSHPIAVMCGASLRVRVRRLLGYQMAAATAAAMMEWQIIRLTSAGTGGGAITSVPIEAGDSASGATGMTLPTAKGAEAAIATWRGAAYMFQTIGASTPFPQPCIDVDFDKMFRSKGMVIDAGITLGFAFKNITAIAAATMIFDVIVSESSY